MINGVAVGALLAVGTTYASEVSRELLKEGTDWSHIVQIAPPRLRGILLGGLPFFIVAMQTVGLGVVRSFVDDTRPAGFRTAFALQWLVGGLPILAFFFVPE
jgi:hypothetical protein